jgi:hypothetical protein
MQNSQNPKRHTPKRICCCTRPDVAQQEPETKCEHQDGRHQKFKQKLHGGGKLKWLQVQAMFILVISCQVFWLFHDYFVLGLKMIGFL